MGLSLQEMIALDTTTMQRIEILSEQAYEKLKIQRKYKGDIFTSIGMMEIGIALQLLGQRNKKERYLKMALKSYTVGLEYTDSGENPELRSRLERLRSSLERSI